VFDDALTPCLLSLPSITPEDEALQLLGSAYPALLLTLQARYHVGHDPKPGQLSSQKSDDKEAYTTRLITLLRDSVISSFHHVSSYSPASTTEESSLASFPYLRLSTFLLEQLRILIKEIGIHTTKYLQEIIPVLYATLTNPFGTACVPLLLAGVATAQAVILNAYPRIWRYRGDFLAAICQCWINVSQDELGADKNEQKVQLRGIKSKLQGTVYLLKLGVQGALSMKVEGGENPNGLGVVDEKDIDIENDVQALVEADEQLKELLQIDVDRDLDNSYFFE
jgi:Tti2 family